MCVRLSDFLRGGLGLGDRESIPLHEELELAGRYLEIERVRFRGRLRVEEEIEPSCEDCPVPALLLQPLVENAIRHGIEPSLHPGLVRVVIQPQASRLKVTVEDNGTGLSSGQRGDSEGTGIGLKNLKARLETLYGLEQGLEFNCRHQGGAVVTVAIPLRRAPTCQPAAIEP